MFKFNKKKKSNQKAKTNTTPVFYFDEILDMLDIAKGAFFKDNDPFILIVSSDKHEDVLQIINRQMAEETRSESNEFGISLCLEFDLSEQSDQDKLQLLKQHKNFGSFIKKEEDGITFYTILLPHDSEQAAGICSSVMVDVFGNKKSDSVHAEFYKVEE